MVIRGIPPTATIPHHFDSSCYTCSLSSPHFFPSVSVPCSHSCLPCSPSCTTYLKSDLNNLLFRFASSFSLSDHVMEITLQKKKRKKKKKKNYLLEYMFSCGSLFISATKKEKKKKAQDQTPCRGYFGTFRGSRPLY